MILALNTAQSIHELAILDDHTGDPNSPREILAERTWPDAKASEQDLVPMLREILDQLGLEKSAITKIMVVAGPGPFTAIRTGVTFANALAEGLGAQLYSMDTFELLDHKVAIKDEASEDPVIVILNAGGLDVAVDYAGERKIGPLAQLTAEISHGSQKVAYELKETLEEELRGIALEKGWQEVKGEKLLTLGEAMINFNFNDAKTQSPGVQAIYLKDPVITKSQDPWKTRNL
jgi:tRNA threonylcarbamoyl adenosine modification protein YeaZ